LSGSTPDLVEELKAFGQGPADELTEGSPERVRWFQDWLDDQVIEAEPDFSAGMNSLSREQLMAYAQRYPDMIARLSPVAQRGEPKKVIILRKARIAPIATLRAAIEATATLKWVDRLEETCGQDGDVLADDTSDKTSKVLFPQLGFSAWLPMSALMEVPEDAAKETVPVDAPRSGTDVESEAGGSQIDESDSKRQRVS